MDEQDLRFFRTSFDRIELLLERIVIALEKKKERKQIVNAEPGAIKLANLWNEWKELKFPKVAGVTPQSARGRNALARWNEKQDEAYWIKVIQRINSSKFCNGDNQRDWVATFDFFVRPDVHYRVLEGLYDNCHLSHKKEVSKPSLIFNANEILLEKIPE